MPARRWLRARWRYFTGLALLALATVAFDAWLGTCGFVGCPTPAAIRGFRPSEGSRVVDRAGRPLGRLTTVRRINVPLAQVPAHVRQAFVATEDRRFFQHHGLDWRAIPRAVIRNVRALGVREGFSTITMQVARNTFTPRLVRERSLRKKLLELRLARLIERNLTKAEILELYLNVIYLGNGVYGVEAASRDLFGKRVRDVTLAEAAVLAALPKGPSAYTPRRYPARARTRRNLVLTLMVREGYVNERRARLAAAEPLVVAEEEWRPPAENTAAVDPVRALVDSVLGPGALERGDVTVYTTIDAQAQRAAERAVRTQAARIEAESRAWYGVGEGEVQGAMVALDPSTGDVRAVVGGRRPERRGFNRAMAARRQPGSAFKPFVYAAALAAGYSPATYVEDEPVEVEQDGRVWTPANFGGEYEGTITLRRALMRSSNAATVRLSRAVGEGNVVAAARRSGITSPLAAVPSIALGALEVTPLELVTAYAPFANGGERVRPRLVRRIEDSDGTVLWSREMAPRVRVLDSRDVYQLTSMLRGVVDRGTGHAIREGGVRGLVAGKTGTTNNGADVWFVGYTPTLVAGFWFGYDNPRALSGDASGGRLAAPAWAEFYSKGWREAPARDAWRAPPGMVMRVVDSYTGELAGEWCEVTQAEWFKPGTEPRTPCRRHREPELDDSFADRLAETLRKIFKF